MNTPANSPPEVTRPAPGAPRRPRSARRTDRQALDRVARRLSFPDSDEGAEQVAPPEAPGAPVRTSTLKRTTPDGPPPAARRQLELPSDDEGAAPVIFSTEGETLPRSETKRVRQDSPPAPAATSLSGAWVAHRDRLVRLHAQEAPESMIDRQMATLARQVPQEDPAVVRADLRALDGLVPRANVYALLARVRVG